MCGFPFFAALYNDGDSLLLSTLRAMTGQTQTDRDGRETRGDGALITSAKVSKEADVAMFASQDCKANAIMTFVEN